MNTTNEASENFINVFTSIFIRVCTHLNTILEKIENLEKDVKEIKDKMNEIWYSPEGPGSVEAKKDFECLSNK